MKIAYRERHQVLPPVRLPESLQPPERVLQFLPELPVGEVPHVNTPKDELFFRSLREDSEFLTLVDDPVLDVRPKPKGANEGVVLALAVQVRDQLVQIVDVSQLVQFVFRKALPCGLTLTEGGPLREHEGSTLLKGLDVNT